LLHEREKWIDKQYGIMHFDPQVGLFGLAGPFKDAMPRGYKLIGEGVGVEPTGILRGDNLRKLNLEKYKLSVEDGDTITLRRRGLKGWLGLGSQYKIRLAGIDAPETGTADYTEDSYHKRQPYAMASKAMLEAMTKQGGDLELFYDPYQSTYGRSVGALYINGQNVNLEMVKRGGAAFLPYGKAEKDIIYRKVFHGFFQAHKYLSDAAGGERITFNTYTRRRKIVESQAQMDALALMEQAEDQGFISNQQIIESQLIGSFLMPGESDSVRPIGLSKAEHYHDLYLDQMKDDLRELMVTRGSKVQQNKFSRKGSYQNLDKSLVLDSMGSTNNIFLKRKLSYINSYSLRAEQRKAMQIYAQQTANQSMFASPIGHHRM
ncbi:MAG: thermonuclease family protein, partial [Candidatus Aenigmarchaeota archaeon]|nr:thermonuclease family protein [Candidatus Aenigmarchaeota archaeon]